ncbi:kinase-like domain-containing protein [Gigaspora rosea]|uniref:Kinase-like domain-containing protein n=1 Tax=Gigaspora rosea TaxID=44941 RepID=A0A397U230_9GLOM|nr:kinase-like domain-containing protein [Gigaspora rosea]
MSRFEESLTDLNKILEINPNDADALGSRGLAYQKTYKYKESLADLTKSLEISPNNKGSLCTRMMLFQDMGEHKKSLEDANKILELNFEQNNIMDLKFREIAYHIKGKYEDSLTEINKLLEIRQEDATLLADCGFLYQKMGEYDKSLECLKKSKKIDSSCAKTLYLRGLTYEKMDKFEKSLKSLNKALEIDPNYVAALKCRGSVYCKMGRYEQSLKDLTKVIEEIDPNEAGALNNRGLTYQAMKKYELSLLDLNKSLEIRPNDLGTLNNRGITYNWLALADFDKALEIEPNNDKALKIESNNDKANCDLIDRDLEKYEELLKNLNESLKIDQNDASAFNSRGIIYNLLAIADFNKALEIEPNDHKATILNNCGLAFRDLGKYEESVKAFTESLEIRPNNLITLSNCGITYLLMKKYEDSFDCLNQALEIKPNDTKVINRYENSMSFGTCENKNCDNKYNKGFSFCNRCDINQEWTTRNEEIDEFIRDAQEFSIYYDKIIEWIPFEQLNDIKEVSDGGFGQIYSATWIDGKRKYTSEKRRVMLSREKNCKVALKCLDDSSSFLKEFKTTYECQLMRHDVEKYGIEIYGITYAPDEKAHKKPNKNKYAMVLEYADQGNLRTYLSKNFAQLSWKQKIEILCSISNNLNHIHQVYSHGDFHSGNILMTSAVDFANLTFNAFTVGSKVVLVSRNNVGEKNNTEEKNNAGEKNNVGKKSRVEPKIIDFGLSKNKDDPKIMKYGVPSYVAPEVLSEEPYTRKSDIYSLGVIMTEVSTGKPPDFYKSAIFEKRPESALGTPDCYIQLANWCMSGKPLERPTAKEVYDKLYEWKIALRKNPEELNKNQLEIRNKFLEADKKQPKISDFTSLASSRQYQYDDISSIIAMCNHIGTSHEDLTEQLTIL